MDLPLSGTLNLMHSSSFSFEFKINKEESYLEYQVASDSALTRLSISSRDDLRELIRDDRAHRWEIVPTDPCDRYAVCGAYGICSTNNSRPLPLCSCLEGFIPTSPNEWSSLHQSSGCRPKTLVGCGKDEFLKVSRVKFPDTSNSSWFNNSISLDDCKMKCLEQGQDMYVLVRSADSKSVVPKHALKDKDISSKERLELPKLDLTTIVRATDNFSSGNKLGGGGFGPVYMGTLADGQEIAVKRLSNSSGQGLDEFKTEILLIAKLHHRNLVKLLGFYEDEKMLIYEYMSNKSLDTFIFGP